MIIIGAYESDMRLCLSAVIRFAASTENSLIEYSTLPLPPCICGDFISWRDLYELTASHETPYAEIFNGIAEGSSTKQSPEGDHDVIHPIPPYPTITAVYYNGTESEKRETAHTIRNPFKVYLGPYNFSVRRR